MTLLLLWLTVMHHCALESLVQGVLQTSTHHASTTSADSCASHSSRDPSAHDEGNPCGENATLEQAKTSLSPSIPLLVVAFVSGFVRSEAASSLERRTPLGPQTSRAHPPSASVRLSRCLFLAPNAPPRVA